MYYSLITLLHGHTTHILQLTSVIWSLLPQILVQWFM